MNETLPADTITTARLMLLHGHPIADVQMRLALALADYDAQELAPALASVAVTLAVARLEPGSEELFTRAKERIRSERGKLVGTAPGVVPAGRGVTARRALRRWLAGYRRDQRA